MTPLRRGFLFGTLNDYPHRTCLSIFSVLMIRSFTGSDKTGPLAQFFPGFPQIFSALLNCTKEDMNNFNNITEFTPDKFTATKWDSADKKAAFAKQFIRFVQSDFAKSKFPKTFYQRLSRTFGHIAHYNQHGFFETFFTSTHDKVRFLRMTLAHQCYGDSEWTYSDVERALQGWLRERTVLSKYETRLAQEQEAEERAVLARLQVKYGTPTAGPLLTP